MSTPDTSYPAPKTRLISVIIPCYNEADNIEETLSSVSAVLQDAHEAYEIWVINDASIDNTSKRVQNLSTKDPRIKELELMKNFGQTVAYQIGLDHANGSHIILFSGDLETPAEQIISVIKALDEGFDFVNTCRENRWGIMHALKSKVANLILNTISGLHIQDRGSGLKGMRHEIAQSLALYGEWHRFIPDLASIYTSRITELKVPFQDRKAGVSSYKGQIKSVSVFLDLATVSFTLLSQKKPYNLLPGRFFGFTGVAIGSIGFAASAYLSFRKFCYGEPLSNRPLFMVAIMLTILGLIMVMIGVIGELIMQIFSILHRQKSHLIRRAQTRGPN